MISTDATDQDETNGYDYDPFLFVPGRIDQITASGLAQLYPELGEHNRVRLRLLPIEQQARLLWDLVERGAIGLNVSGRSEREGRDGER